MTLHLLRPQILQKIVGTSKYIQKSSSSIEDKLHITFLSPVFQSNSQVDSLLSLLPYITNDLKAQKKSVYNSWIF